MTGHNKQISHILPMLCKIEPAKPNLLEINFGVLSKLFVFYAYTVSLPNHLCRLQILQGIVSCVCVWGGGVPPLSQFTFLKVVVSTPKFKLCTEDSNVYLHWFIIKVTLGSLLKIMCSYTGYNQNQFYHPLSTEDCNFLIHWF